MRSQSGIGPSHSTLHSMAATTSSPWTEGASSSLRCQQQLLQQAYMLACGPQSPRQEAALLLVNLQILVMLLLPHRLPLTAPSMHLLFSRPWRQVCS